MKYKTGDLVVIRHDLKPGKKYNRYLFVKAMDEYAGEIARIVDVGPESYTLDADNMRWSWTDDMLKLYVRADTPSSRRNDYYFQRVISHLEKSLDELKNTDSREGQMIREKITDIIRETRLLMSNSDETRADLTEKHIELMKTCIGLNKSDNADDAVYYAYQNWCFSSGQGNEWEYLIKNGLAKKPFEHQYSLTDKGLNLLAEKTGKKIVVSSEHMFPFFK